MIQLMSIDLMYFPWKWMMNPIFRWFSGCDPEDDGSGNGDQNGVQFEFKFHCSFLYIYASNFDHFDVFFMPLVYWYKISISEQMLILD